MARKDAEKAMENVNGQVIKKVGGKAKVDAEGRPVAVDWALSKEKWEETQKPAKGDVPEASASSSASGSSSENGEENVESASGSGDEDGDVDMDEGSDEDMNGETKDVVPVKPQLPAVDVGSTLFIRNLPFETTEQELNTL